MDSSIIDEIPDAESSASESVETTSSTSRDGREGEKLTGAYQGDWDNYERRTKMSSGVAFKPHPRYWLIGGKWYDLEPFVDKHPGGRKMLLDARDRFDDCTFVFEAHHVNYTRARAVLKKYQVEGYNESEGKASLVEGKYHVKLLDDDAFYSVLRRRVHVYLKENGGPGPTFECVALFWAVLAAYLALWASLLQTGSVLAVFGLILVGAPLGGFGHNWVHMPEYRNWALVLDALGFSSEQWIREHNLQHHMYTNTEKDNHFKGTDPFLVTDPTVERNFFQRVITPRLTPVVLSFGMWGNYLIHTLALLKGEENFSIGKIFLPLEVTLLVYTQGWQYGLSIAFVMYGTVAVIYFTYALMNHNAEKCVDVARRNKSADFGIAQLNSSADWAVGCSFLGSLPYLWLNYHTVHHLFPNVCMSKHPGIQKIMLETIKEFDVEYHTSDVTTLYREMKRTFAKPHSLQMQLDVYAGGI